MEAGWFKSGRHRGDLTGELPVVVCFSFCGRDGPNGLEQATVVEPGDPFEGGQFHRRLDARFRQTLGAADADALRAEV